MSPHNDLLFDGPEDGATIILAHGAGVPMDHAFMSHFAEALGARNFRVARFEFPYMWQRRQDGKRRPPNKPEVLLETWRLVDSHIGASPLIVGGKSMGGRFASMLAGELGARACLCLGYPFHPPGKPENLRTQHLEKIHTPTLILQGSRDTMGNRETVEALELPPSIRVHWAEDGDHDLKPRQASGRNHKQNLDEAVEAIASFIEEL